MPATNTKKPAQKTGDKKKTGAKPQGVQKPKRPESKASMYKNLFIARPKIFGIGQARPHKLDLTRYVKWPKYVRLQRQRRVLFKRLKIPPAVNQFNRAANKPLAARIFKLLEKYRPEDAKAKRERLRSASKTRVKGEKAKAEVKHIHLHAGINTVTNLVERQKAQLVIIAHDVDPLELVLFLPTLCKKLGIPYAIVKSKSRLGQLVHLKNTSVVCLTDVRKEDKDELAKVLESVRGSFNERFAEQNRQWGGLRLSRRSLEFQKAKLAKV